jgi:hypothetical protein
MTLIIPKLPVPPMTVPTLHVVAALVIVPALAG